MIKTNMLLKPSLMMRPSMFVPFQRMFIGKTEDGFKFRTP